MEMLLRDQGISPSNFELINHGCLRRERLSRRAFTLGTQLIAQDEPHHSIVLLTSGIVKLSYLEENGKELIAGLRRADCIIGAESALLALPSLFTVTALTDCSAQCIPAARFRTIVERDPSFALQVSKALAGETIRQTEALLETASRTALQRLLSFLRANDDVLEDTANGMSSLKKQEIAQLLTITPEHLSRLIQKLIKRGLISKDGRRLRLACEN